MHRMNRIDLPLTQSDVLHDELPQIAAIGLEDLLRDCTPSGFGLQVKLQVKLSDGVVPRTYSLHHVAGASLPRHTDSPSQTDPVGLVVF